jgi:hypothetical protein
VTRPPLPITHPPARGEGHENEGGEGDQDGRSRKYANSSLILFLDRYQLWSTLCLPCSEEVVRLRAKRQQRQQQFAWTALYVYYSSTILSCVRAACGVWRCCVGTLTSWALLGSTRRGEAIDAGHGTPHVTCRFAIFPPCSLRLFFSFAFAAFSNVGFALLLLPLEFGKLRTSISRPVIDPLASRPQEPAVVPGTCHDHTPARGKRPGLIIVGCAQNS